MKISTSLILNKFTISLGVVTGVFLKLLGGKDDFLISLVILIILDFASGIMKGIIKKTLDSKISIKGLVNKFMYLLVIAVATQMDILMKSDVWRTATISLLIANEMLSILENATICGVPIPEKIKKVLKQYREEVLKKEEEKQK